MIGVCIVTYNQEAFIAKALDSVLEQKGCPEIIRIYVGNDGSTDRTAEICEEYEKKHPETITLINNTENLGLVKNTVNVLKNILSDGCDYVAMLDGDDYWCDPFKLKKQIGFLSANQNYGLVHTRSYLLTNNSLKKSPLPTPPVGDVFSEMGKFSIANCTVVFRSNLLRYVNLEEFTTKGLYSADYIMYVIFSAKTLFGFIDDHTAVWRRDITSVSNPQNERKQIDYLNNDKAVQMYLAELFPDRFSFDEESWRNFYNNRVFNIAFNYQDYSLAHATGPKLHNQKNGFFFKIKLLCATNKFFFFVWGRLKRISSILK